MNSELKLFLESGLLEEYLLGLCDESEIETVESYIRKYPEVKREYDRLQQSIELYTRKIAVPPPPGTKAAIIKEVNWLDSLKSKTNRSTSLATWLTAAAAVLLLVTSFWFWKQWMGSEDRNRQLVSEYAELKQNCELDKKQMIALDQRLRLLSDPNTSKVVLQGKANDSDFNAVAYWNKNRQSSYIEVISHPELPEKECLQLWADVDGKMVSLGVIPARNQNFYELPFKVNAESLNITIEPEGGSDHPNVSRLVASISI